MAEAPIRRLGAADLPAYKALRDDLLARHPEAFTSDAAVEAGKPPAHYAGRFGLDRDDEACFTLGAFDGTRLIGALSCERDPGLKVRHVGRLIGMMVTSDRRRAGTGTALLREVVDAVRALKSLERLTLSVTATNADAVRLYERAGFVRYGRLEAAIKLGDRHHAKDLMVLPL